MRQQWVVDKGIFCPPSLALFCPIGHEPDQDIVRPCSELRRDVMSAEDRHDLFMGTGPIEKIDEVCAGFGVKFGKLEMDGLAFRCSYLPFAVRTI